MITKETLTEKFADLRDIGQQTREYTPEEMAWAYIKGYNHAINIACEFLETIVTRHKSFFGEHEQRVFDDDFIKRFRKETKIK